MQIIASTLNFSSSIVIYEWYNETYYFNDLLASEWDFGKYNLKDKSNTIYKLIIDMFITSYFEIYLKI